MHDPQGEARIRRAFWGSLVVFVVAAAAVLGFDAEECGYSVEDSPADRAERLGPTSCGVLGREVQPRRPVLVQIGQHIPAHRMPPRRRHSN